MKSSPRWSPNLFLLSILSLAQGQSCHLLPPRETEQAGWDGGAYDNPPEENQGSFLGMHLIEF
jgi:hypothetical protein